MGPSSTITDQKLCRQCVETNGLNPSLGRYTVKFLRSFDNHIKKRTSHLLWSLNDFI